VWALKRDFPDLHFSLNGGVMSSTEAKALLGMDMDGHRIDGVMVVWKGSGEPCGSDETGK
jgi:hypothetical protein